MGIWDILYQNKHIFLEGLGVTLSLCFIIFPISVLIGSLLGYYSSKKPKTLGLTIKIFSILVSSTPILVFLFWMHYPFQYLFHLRIDPFNTSVLVISISATFLMFDYVYNAFKTFPIELISTAKVIGLSNAQIAKKIQFPIIFRQLLPQIIVLFSFILQATIFCSFISVGELFKKAQEINADIFKPIELYSIVALFFISICLFINLLSLYFKRKYSYDLNKY